MRKVIRGRMELFGAKIVVLIKCDSVTLCFKTVSVFCEMYSLGISYLTQTHGINFQSLLESQEVIRIKKEKEKKKKTFRLLC